MNEHEALGFGLLSIREPFTKVVLRNQFGEMVFAGINTDALVAPEGNTGTKYFKVFHPQGIILCGASDFDPNNLTRQNVQKVHQGDWVSVVGGVLASVSDEYFNLKYPGVAAPDPNSAKAYVPLSSDFIKEYPESINKAGFVPVDYDPASEEENLPLMEGEIPLDIPVVPTSFPSARTQSLTPGRRYS